MTCGAAVGVVLLLPAGHRHPGHRRRAFRSSSWSGSRTRREVRGAIASWGMVVPCVLLLLGAAGMPRVGLPARRRALVVTFGLNIVGLLVRRWPTAWLGAARDLSASALVAFVPDLPGLVRLDDARGPGDGRELIVVFILVTVFSDIGGYAVGVGSGGIRWCCRSALRSSGRGFAGLVAILPLAVGADSLLLLLGALGGRAPSWGVVRRRSDSGDPTESSIKRRPGHQGHGRAAARARRADGPPRLARRGRAHLLGAAHGVRAAGLSTERRDRPVSGPATQALNRSSAALGCAPIVRRPPWWSSR